MNRPNAIRVYGSYGRYLLKEFRWPLGLFLGMIFGGGLLMHLIHEDRPTYGEACYTVFRMLFFEPAEKFPQSWLLEVFYYAAPVLGIFVIADGLVRFGILLFQKKTRLKEWWLMEVSTYRNHIIVAGVGKVGYRIINELRQLGELVVGIEKEPDKLLTRELQDSGVPIIFGDARLKATLTEANVQTASAIICATNDDLANLDIALTAREINPAARVVLRIFDDTLAQKFASEFKMPAISTSQAASRVFVAAATGRSVYFTFQLDRDEVHMADLSLTPGSKLIGKSLQEIESGNSVRVVCYHSGSTTDLHPKPDIRLKANDTIVVLASHEEIRKLEELNR